MTKVWLDSSVIISGIYSDSGASNFILRLCRKKKISVYTSTLIIKEVVRNLKKKFPQKFSVKFAKYLAKSNFQKTEFISEEEVSQYSQYTHKKDLHVLAGAAVSGVEYLVSLDKKHLLSLTAKKLPFAIVSPKEFLQKFIEEKKK